MTVEKIGEMGLINDDTEIVIREGEGFGTLARGNWYQDDILAYENCEVESLTWQDDNRIYIDVKTPAESTQKGSKNIPHGLDQQLQEEIEKSLEDLNLYYHERFRMMTGRTLM